MIPISTNFNRKSYVCLITRDDEAIMNQNAIFPKYLHGIFVRVTPLRLFAVYKVLQQNVHNYIITSESFEVNCMYVYIMYLYLYILTENFVMFPP